MTRREFMVTAGALPAPGFAALETDDAFSGVPAATRLRMHWWVFGMAWTKDEAERQLQMMSDAHIGSVLIFPAHPYEIDDPARGVHNQQFLSPEFFQVLNAVVAKSRQLGLILDIVAGTGWPYGGPTVTPEESARMIQRVRFKAALQEPIQLPDMKPGEQAIAAFHVRPDAIRRLPQLSGEIRLDDVAPGSEVHFFYTKVTGQQVKRASVGAEGHVVDHYNRTAVEHYLDQVGTKLLTGTPPGSFRSFFCDSLEVYRANWTPKFPEQFRRHRGYDLVELLPALFDGSHETSRDLRHDFWKTLSELTKEEFVDTLAHWGREHQIAVQVEAYGAPPVALAGYQNVDVPCGEGFEWKTFAASRWASSGGRLAGKRMIATEGWTWLGYPNRFGDSMEGLKVASDLQFLCGINETYGVTYAYSPVRFGAPGWPPYFGPIVNHTQPYWPYFSRLADYIARTQWVLQQGRPITDIALYLAEEDCFAAADVDELQLRFNRQFGQAEGDRNHRMWSATERGAPAITTIATNGYSFDGVDWSIFGAGLQASGGRLKLGDGDYGVLVMPNVGALDPRALQTIQEFVSSGGVFIATRRLPDKAFGVRERTDGTRRVTETMRLLFGEGRFHDHLRVSSFGRGKAIFCPDDEASLLAALHMSIKSDIEFHHASRYVGFQHRATPDRDFYFVANTSREPFESLARFRSARPACEYWNPRTGTRTRLELDNGKASVRLDPYESAFIVFCDSPGSTPKAPVLSATNTPASVALTTPWKLRLNGDTVQIPSLQSWTDLEKHRYFSGIGIYETEFDAPRLATGIRSQLDLGCVCEVAEVSLNGIVIGVTWMRPHLIDITDTLRPGPNTLLIKVANLLINRVLGEGPIDYSKVIAKYGDRFPGGDEWELIREPFPSGLLGPVRLVFFREGA